MTPRADQRPTPCALVLTLLGGAALGAVTMALTTPRTGREVRGTLRGALLGRRAQADAGDGLDPEALEAMFI
jgi:hypothetical protein